MNQAWERRRPAGLVCPFTRKRRLAGETPALPAEHLGSWSQCMRKKRKGAISIVPERHAGGACMGFADSHVEWAKHLRWTAKTDSVR
jgi:prepilin-type processing-associated H-X9-DG protein